MDLKNDFSVHVYVEMKVMHFDFFKCVRQFNVFVALYFLACASQLTHFGCESKPYLKNFVFFRGKK